MDGVQDHAAPREHIARDRAVNPARNEQHTPAAAARRHPALAFLGKLVDTGVTVPDLHIDNGVRPVHVDPQMRERVEQMAADLRADLGRAQGELLVRPLGLDLESAQLGQARPQKFVRRPVYLVHILAAQGRQAYGADSKHLFARAVCAGHVGRVILRLHVAGGLGDIGVKTPERSAGTLYAVQQQLFKAAAVLALEGDFAELKQNDLSHTIS